MNSITIIKSLWSIDIYLNNYWLVLGTVFLIHEGYIVKICIAYSCMSISLVDVSEYV